MIVAKPVSAVSLYRESLRFKRAAETIDINYGKIMAATMKQWAQEFLIRLQQLASSGGLPASPMLEGITTIISENKGFTYDTGKFWGSMTVGSVYNKNWARVWIEPTGIASHSFGPRSEHIFPMTLLMAAIGYTEDNPQDPQYAIVIKDPKKVRNVLRYIFGKAYEKGGLSAIDKQDTETDEEKPKKALIIRVPQRPIIPKELWDEAVEDLKDRLLSALQTEIERSLQS